MSASQPEEYWFHAMSNGALKQFSSFKRALALMEALSVEDRAVLVDVVSKRLAAARRVEIGREAAAARRQYRHGKVKRGSASDLMAELRAT